MERTTTTRKSKSCAVCGNPFEFRRADAQTCGSAACRKTFTRHGPQKQPGDDKPYFWRPPSLHFALIALEKGIPLDGLILKPHEKMALEATWPGFPLDRRLRAAGELLRLRAPWVGSSFVKDAKTDIRLDTRARRQLVIDALESAQNETVWFGVWKLGFARTGRRVTGRRKVAPYVPARDEWGILLSDFLPREIERRLHRIRRTLRGDLSQNHRNAELSFVGNDLHAQALSLQGSAGTNEDGDVRTLDEAIGATGPEVAWESPRGSGFCSYKQAHRRPSNLRWNDEEQKWLAKESWLEANPPLTPKELKQLRRELAGSPMQHAIKEYEEQSWGEPDQDEWDDRVGPEAYEGPHAAHGGSEDKMMLAEELRGIRQELREINEKLPEKPYSPVREAEALLEDATPDGPRTSPDECGVIWTTD